MLLSIHVDFSARASKDIPAGVKQVWLEWDITPLAQQWIDFTANNFGLLINNEESKDIKFASREAAEATDYPQLVIVTP